MTAVAAKQATAFAKFLASLLKDGADRAIERAQQARQLLRTYVGHLTERVERRVNAAAQCL